MFKQSWMKVDFARNNLSASVVNLGGDRISWCKNSWISVYWQLLLLSCCLCDDVSSAVLTAVAQTRAPLPGNVTVYSVVVIWARVPALIVLCCLYFLFYRYHLPRAVRGSIFVLSSNSPHTLLTHGVGQNKKENNSPFFKTKVYKTFPWSSNIYGYAWNTYLKVIEYI